MNAYKVQWRIPGRGEYVPEDPCITSGGYYKDLYGVDIITAPRGDDARELVKMARETAIITKVRLLKRFS